MAVSVSSKSSSLLRHHPDERTPLLEGNDTANKPSLARASSSLYQQQEGSEERSHDDSKALINGEGQHQGGDSGSASQDDNTASSKTSSGIVGVISVLLLGLYIFRHYK